MHDATGRGRAARRRRLVGSLFAAALAGGLCAAGAAGAIAFAKADQNGDGVVVFEEARIVYPQLMKVTFRKCANKQGFIDQGHWPCLENIYQLLYRSPE
ncbi:MAG TPA: hypothetical protein PKA33_17645 [Amaricoccus sp.]|uniref:hypothetical protein n=1 Tax=Amaricoccus sp. TaxID=1872485 RepID=UPI002BC30D37|nr:hypothetical protein [Amaricoccus sp.]HMQ95074.1 hypothetical protein [Amaricoccus sp.]HMR54155.1 hypothetical protein [Amaricoccus sp.]HMR61978.1 hypothetical protein [Amaricoccus sp.]HMU01172.1 hypothetical protein [Amaricoccus sp.]